MFINEKREKKIKERNNKSELAIMIKFCALWHEIMQRIGNQHECKQLETH